MGQVERGKRAFHPLFVMSVDIGSLIRAKPNIDTAKKSARGLVEDLAVASTSMIALLPTHKRCRALPSKGNRRSGHRSSK